MVANPSISHLIPSPSVSPSSLKPHFSCLADTVKFELKSAVQLSLMFAMKSLGLIVKGAVPVGLRSPTLLQRKLYSSQRLSCPRNSSLPKATSIPTSTYTESPLIKPDLLDDADGPSAKVLVLEGNIERVIYGCRFFTLLSVAGSLFGSVICFLKGCVYVLDSFKVGIGGGGKVIMTLVEAVDIYLIGTVMLVFGMGIYELFISNLDIAKTSTDGSNMLGLFKLSERPQWLEIKSLNELETKFGNVIVTVLLVGLLEKCKKVTIISATDLLCFATSVLLCSASLYLMAKLHTSKEGKHVSH